MTITATHTNRDPVFGAQPPVTHSIVVGEWDRDRQSVVDSLVTLFRCFNLPNGGTLIVKGYGKTIEWEYDGFLVPLAQKLLA